MSDLAVKRQFLDTASGQLHLRVAGAPSARPAIVCLHLMPKSGRSFAKLLPELAQGRLVIAPDFPGCGESDPYPDGVMPSIPRYASSILEVIAHFNIQRACFVGYHTGAMVAAEIALRRPALAEKLVCISAPILTEAEAADFQRRYAAIPLDEEGTRFKAMWARVLAHRGPGMTLPMAATSMAESLRGGERYEEGHQAAFAHSRAFAEALGKIEQPVLVMNVGDDLFELSKRADGCMRNGRRVDYPQWGHGFLEVWPREAAAAMREFLDA